MIVQLHNTNIISHIPGVKFMNNGLKTDDSKQSAGEGYDTAQRQHHNGQQRLCSNQNVNVHDVVPLTIEYLCPDSRVAFLWTSQLVAHP